MTIEIHPIPRDVPGRIDAYRKRRCYISGECAYVECREIPIRVTHEAEYQRTSGGVPPRNVPVIIDAKRGRYRTPGWVERDGYSIRVAHEAVSRSHSRMISPNDVPLIIHAVDECVRMSSFRGIAVNDVND